MSTTGVNTPGLVRRSHQGNGPTQSLCRSPPQNSPAESELRLVLLGRTGAGKSATGNTILGKRRFDEDLSMSSVTKECRRERAAVEERQLTLVDTPGFFDTDLTEEQQKQEVLNCLALSSPGPHAFLLVIPIERFTEEQQCTVERILEMFHGDIRLHTVLVFSHADRLKGKSIESFISGQKRKIQDLLKKFGKRFVAFDNNDPSNRDQVKRLLETVDELLEENENKHFRNELMETIEEAQRIMEQNLAERRRKIKEEVKKAADDRWSAFTASLEEERRRAEDRKRCVRNKITQLEATIKQANQKLRQSRACLKREQENMWRIQETEMQEELERIKRERTQKDELEIWRQKEERRRLEEAERGDLLSPEYRRILVMLSLFLIGVGAGYAPVLLGFLFPAAPAVEVGLSAQILTQMLGWGAMGSRAAAWKATGVGVNAALNLAATQCSIQ